MVAIGEHHHRRTSALITDMDLPLGLAIGNSLEVAESVQTLQGKGPQDLEEVCLALAANMGWNYPSARRSAMSCTRVRQWKMLFKNCFSAVQKKNFILDPRPAKVTLTRWARVEKTAGFMCSLYMPPPPR